MRQIQSNLISVGHEQLTTASGAVGLTASNYAGARYAYISVSGSAVRWRDDGISPTAAVGQLLATGGTTQPFLYTGPLNQIEFIETAADATVDVSYYK